MRTNGNIPLVIHVLTSLDYGGVESHMELIGSVLDHANMRHMFVSIGKGGAAAERLRTLGAEVRCLGEETRIPSFAALRSLSKLFRCERPFVVHTHGAEANFHGLLSAWFARVPVRIGEEIGIPSHSRRARFVFRAVYVTAHRVIGVSKIVMEWLVANCEVPQSKVTMIYNPVKLPPLRQSTDFSDIFFRIGFVGRLEAVKNPVTLLDAFLLLLSGGVPCELWLIGEGSERAILERQISKNGLEDKVRLFGYLPDPSNVIRQCHVCVQPSFSEGFSLSLVEAMGCGVPVIATAVGAAPELIVHGKTGWLLSQATPEKIASTLEKAWQAGPQKLREMGFLAHNSVRGCYEPVNYLKQIETLYLQLPEERSE